MASLAKSSKKRLHFLKKQTKCFSFCIFNNAMYNKKSTNKVFEQRYLNGLLKNIETIRKLNDNWNVVVYIDKLLDSYFSDFHYSTLNDLLCYNNVTLIWTTNDYKKPIGFALERYLILSDKSYNLVAIRDVDQILTPYDIELLNSFSISTDDSMLYRSSASKAWYCMGGGFATKKTGQSFILKSGRFQMDRYLKGCPNGLGYEEYYMDKAFTNSNISLGKERIVLTEFRNNKWYSGKTLLFGKPGR